MATTFVEQVVGRHWEPLGAFMSWIATGSLHESDDQLTDSEECVTHIGESFCINGLTFFATRMVLAFSREVVQTFHHNTWGLRFSIKLNRLWLAA